MKHHANLSVFVPHVGCPCRCVFCDQRSISGEQSLPTGASVDALCREFLPGAGEGRDVEIAFFGGSFTAVERGYMTELLAAAYPFVREGRAAGIRLSTRPDAVDPEVLDILKGFGVAAIELGAQSMSDEVLSENRRGHTAGDVVRASRLIKERGFSLGLQMMVGMYGECDPRAGALATAHSLAALRPDTIRIYPTLVVAGTELHSLWLEGRYRPLETDEAADICAEIIPIFEAAGARIIRLGLHGDRSIAESCAAGPFHPAFGEKCYSRVWRKRVEGALGGRRSATVFVSPSRLSVAIGNGRENIGYFRARGVELTVRQDPNLAGDEFRLDGD